MRTDISEICKESIFKSLQWHHNDCHGITNYWHLDCLINHVFRCTSKITWKLCVTGLCVGNPPVTGGFPSQRSSSMENVSISCCHHVDEWQSIDNAYDTKNLGLNRVTRGQCDNGDVMYQLSGPIHMVIAGHPAAHQAIKTVQYGPYSKQYFFYHSHKKDSVRVELGVPHEDVLTWKCLVHYRLFVRGIHQSFLDSPFPSQEASNVVWFVVCIDRLLNKQSSCKWFQMPCCPSDAIAL